MSGTQSIRSHGWMQGSVLTPQLAGRADLAAVLELTESHRLVVVSQDCDVQHPDYEVEGRVELIAARLLDDNEADPRLEHGRNPRRLLLQATVDGRSRWLEFDVRHRIVVDRTLLEQEPPDASVVLDGASIKLLAGWVAKRYTRAAFPDEFNRRFAQVRRKLDAALKQRGEHVTGLYLMLDPYRECESTENYRVVLRMTAASQALADEEQERKLVACLARAVEVLGECDGIEVIDNQLVSEAEFTLEDLHYFRRWDWDFRSHSGRPGGEIAPIP